MCARSKFFSLFHNFNSCSIKIVYNARLMSIVELLLYFNASQDVLKKLYFSFLINRVPQENLASRRAAINGYPCSAKRSSVTSVFLLQF